MEAKDWPDAPGVWEREGHLYEVAKDEHGQFKVRRLAPNQWASNHLTWRCIAFKDKHWFQRSAARQDPRESAQGE